MSPVIIPLLVTVISIGSAQGQLSDVVILADNGLSGIYYVNISTNGPFTRLPTPVLSGAYSVAYDPGRDLVFLAGFIPKSGNFIGRMKSDGSQFVYQLVPSESLIFTLALDTVSQVVYFADEGEHAIGIMSYDTKRRNTIITSYDGPTGLVLNPAKRKLHFASNIKKKTTTNIVEADMDGSNPRIIYTIRGFVIIDMAIDHAVSGNDLYFVEDGATTSKIVKFNTITRQRTDILNGNTAFGYLTLALDGYSMYIARVNNKSLERHIKDGSYGQRFGTVPTGNSTVYDMFVVTPSTRLTYTTSCSVNNGGCVEFCLPTPRGRTCACTEGFMLQSDGSCLKSPFTDFVIFSDFVRDGIFLIDLQTNVSKRLDYVGLHGVTGISYADGNVYWAHQTGEHIVKGCLNVADGCGRVLSFLNPTSDDQTISKVEDIAIDPTNGNIFVVDSKRNMIFTIMNTTTFTTKIIETGLDEPAGLALDPIQRLMFWTDTGYPPKIERASMETGGNRRVLINSGLRQPLDIVVDRPSSHIYWCDSEMLRIERSNYDGTNRQVAVRNPLMYTSLAVDPNYIYFAHLGSRSVYRVSKSTGQGMQAIGPSVFHQVFDMAVVNLRAPPLSPIQRKDTGFVMFVDAIVGAVWTVDLMGRNLTKLPITNLRTPIACDYDARNRQVFLLEHGNSESQSSPKMIIRASLDGRSQFVTRLPGNSKPYGLALDMISQIIYYTDSKEKLIGLYSMDFRYHKVLQSNIDHIQFIGVDYMDGKIFYGAGASGQGKILSADGSGENVREIISRDIGDLGEISVDTVEKMIYWTDTNYHRVERCSYTGSNRQVLQDSSSGNRHIAIALDDLYVYFSTYSHRQIQRFPKTGGTVRLFYAFTSASEQATDICVHKPISRSPESNACSGSNGGCNQLCLPTPSGRRCACDEKYTLDTDRTTCIPSPFRQVLILTDKERSGIFVIDVTTGARYRVPYYDLNGVTGIGWDPKEDKFYWVDTSYMSLKVGCLDRAQCSGTVIQWTDQMFLDHLAVDYDRGYIYMVESLSRVILRVSPLTKVNKTIIRVGNSGGKPRAIALDLTKRLLYWTDIGPDPKIERASMDDGSGRETLIDSGLNSPNDIAIDDIRDEMFWCDGGTRKIEKSTTSGANRRTLLSGNAICLSITIDDTYVYFFSTGGSSSIQRIDRNTGQGLQAIGGKGLFHVFSMIYVDTRGSPVVDPTFTTPSPMVPSGGPVSDDVSGKPESMLPLYIGIGVGGAVVLVILIVAVTLCCCLTKKKRRRATQVNVEPKPDQQQNAGNHYQTLQPSAKGKSKAKKSAKHDTYINPIATDPDTLALVLLQQNQENQAQMRQMQDQMLQLQVQTMGMVASGEGLKVPLEDVKGSYESLPRPDTPDYINMKTQPPPYEK